MRRARIGLLLLACWPAAARAVEGAAWLKIPQGARSVALGTAVTALPGSAEAMWYTPAALAGLKSADLSVSRQAWLGQTRDDYLGAALPLGSGGLGVYGSLLGSEDIYRDAQGLEGGTFSDSAWTAGLAYGVQLGPLGIGLAAKSIHEQIERSQSSGWAGDAGAQLQLGAPWARFGFSVQNMGQFNGDQSLGVVRLPLAYRLGLALDHAIPGVTLSVESLQYQASRESTLMGGIEGAFQLGIIGVALRGGYQNAVEEAGGMAGLALGAGLRMENLSFDLAYTPYGALGDPYRMTLGWDFGGGSAGKR